jgi:hypothetical protein
MTEKDRTFEAELMALINGVLEPRAEEKVTSRAKKAGLRPRRRPTYTIEMIQRIIARIQEL